MLAILFDLVDDVLSLVVLLALVAGVAAFFRGEELREREAETRAIVRQVEQRLAELEGAKSVLEPKAPNVGAAGD